MAVTQVANVGRLSTSTLTTLSEQLPEVAERCVAAITDEVPGYANALAGEYGPRIEGAVQQALAGFLRLARTARGNSASTPMRPALDGAYALGQGEARSGRSMDALLAAYRLGARVSWRELSTTLVADGVDAETIAQFAELVFAYIDGLSAASVAGHAEVLASAGRERDRRRERLAADLIAGRDEEALSALAVRADWTPPETLTAILLPSDQVARIASALGSNSLVLPEDSTDPQSGVVLAPDGTGTGRRRLTRALKGTSAYIGPALPWHRVATSYARAQRARGLGLGSNEPVDADEHLATLVLHADRDAWSDLAQHALTPLADLPQATAQRLGETLRSWLLHQGRRDAVADDLHVHPQTVRYRMTQVRDLFGDQLDDPDQVMSILIALSPASH